MRVARTGLLVDVVLPVEPAHQQEIDEDEHDEDIDGSLLRKPEPQRESAQPYRITSYNVCYTKLLRAELPHR